MLEPFFKKENKLTETNDKNDNTIYGILMKPENADADNSKDIDYKEATLLGIALSVNNIGGGLSAGMIGLNSFFVGLFSAIISFLALWAGNYITEFFNRWNLGKKANIIAGIVLILIGIKQVL
jgi:putative sporulation protein YtaF